MIGICCLMLLYSFCVVNANTSTITTIYVNSTNSVIDMANHTRILLMIECPEEHEYTDWYHDGNYFEPNRSNDNDRNMLNVIVSDFDDGGEFKCGSKDEPLQSFSSVNISFGRKPSMPEKLRCTSHLHRKASCTWQPGSRETNLPGTFSAFTKNVSKQWVLCNVKDNNICELEMDNVYKDVKVMEKNSLGTSRYAVLNYNMHQSVRPFPPTDLTLTIVEENKVMAEWGPPEGWQEDYYYLSYELRWKVILSDSPWKKVFVDTNNVKIDDHVFEEWNPYTTYEVQVRAKYFQADFPGTWSESVTITTNEAYPVGQLELFQEETESDHKDKKEYRNIVLTWKVPDKMKARGKILGFEIKLHEWGIQKDALNLTDGSLTQYILKDLLRDANYTVYMSAYNSIAISAPAFLDIPLSPKTMMSSATIIAVIVCIGIVILLLFLGFAWVRIKETKLCLPLPEPNFLTQWKNINSNTSIHVEDEVFDEVKQRRAVPTKDDIDKLLKKLPDPILKDIILELLISKYAIDHDWKNIKTQRRSRLASTNTEFSFLSDGDEDERLISNLGSRTDCKIMPNLSHVTDNSFSRCHSLPLLDKKFTKDFNIKEDAYISDSGDTSGIGSESSDQDIETDLQPLLPCQIFSNIHCNIPSPNESPSEKIEQACDEKPQNKPSQSVNNEPLQVNSVKANEVENVVQPSHKQTWKQPGRQQSVSDYLDAAQMKSLGNHASNLKQKRLIKKKPRNSCNGYVDVKDMPKCVSHHPKLHAKSMPKPLVYVQHEELSSLLADTEASMSKISTPAIKHQTNKSSKCEKTKSAYKFPTHSNIDDNSRYVKSVSIKHIQNENPNNNVDTPNKHSEMPNKGEASNYVTLHEVGVIQQDAVNLKSYLHDKGVQKKFSAEDSTEIKESDFNIVKSLNSNSSKDCSHLDSGPVQKNRALLKHETLPNREPHGIKSSLPRCKNSDLQNIQSCVPQQTPCEPFPSEVNISKSSVIGNSKALPMTTKSQIVQKSNSPPRNLSTQMHNQHSHQGTSINSAIPKQNLQKSDSKVDQRDSYVPIRSMLNVSTDSCSSLSQTHPNQKLNPNPNHKPHPKQKLRPRVKKSQETVVPAKSHFQNQGKMIKCQNKPATVVYKVTPSV